MIDKEKLKRRFSRNAKHYDQYAGVQKKMGDWLIRHTVNEGRRYESILEIGCGTGYVTRALAKHFPNAAITAVDIATGMIEHAKSTLESSNVGFLCGDIEELDIRQSFDLIISNATFQWFNQLDSTLLKLTALLKNQGMMCFSTFGTGTFKELHEAFRKAGEELAVSEPVTPGQPFYSLEALWGICKETADRSPLGNLRVSAEEAYEYEYFDCCMDFLSSVKKIGANNSQSGSDAVIPGFVDKVMEIYDRDYMEAGKVKATYHNLFVYMK